MISSCKNKLRLKINSGLKVYVYCASLMKYKLPIAMLCLVLLIQTRPVFILHVVDEWLMLKMFSLMKKLHLTFFIYTFQILKMSLTEFRGTWYSKGPAQITTNYHELQIFVSPSKVNSAVIYHNHLLAQLTKGMVYMDM